MTVISYGAARLPFLLQHPHGSAAAKLTRGVAKRN